MCSVCSGSTTTCGHSQELTPGLLELKATDEFTASVPFMAVQEVEIDLPNLWLCWGCALGHGETQTMSHIVESCPQTRLHGGLSTLHSADDDAIAWLTSYGS